jgi:hypothetical protein
MPRFVALIERRGIFVDAEPERVSAGLASIAVRDQDSDGVWTACHSTLWCVLTSLSIKPSPVWLIARRGQGSAPIWISPCLVHNARHIRSTRRLGIGVGAAGRSCRPG